MKPTGGDDPVDRAAPTPRIPSGSYETFFTRSHILLEALLTCEPRTRDTKIVLEALQAEADAMAEECNAWPTTAPSDASERLAASTDLSQRLKTLEDRVKSFLDGGR